MNVFAALADDHRKSIVEMLARKGDLSVAQIRRAFAISAPAISQHLKVLREARVVKVTRQAQKRIYSIDERGIGEIDDWLAKTRALWTKRLDSLDGYLSKLNKEAKRNVRKG